jgi:cytosine/adenosine deaminase-related metal-dependent hydrolase
MDRAPLRDAAVAISGDTIIQVGDFATVRRDRPDAIIHDLGATILLPGLINPHVHLELSDLPRPAHATDRPLADWLIEVIRNSPQPGDAERVRLAVAEGVSQCLRFGVTTVGDISRQPALTRPLLRHAPLRVVSFGEVQAMATRRDLLKPRLAAAAERTHEGGRLRVGISPHAPYSIEPAGYTRCLELARAEGIPLATHLAESPDEAPFLSDHAGPFRELWRVLNAWDERVPRFPGGPIRFAQSLGLLDEPTVLAHVNYCDDAELALLAAGRASVVYCPRTHAYFGHPPHRWRDMLAAGVNVALGTDSLASSPDLNLVDDLRLLRRLAPDVPADTLWRLITTRAARALGMHESVGTLAPGMAADLVAFPISESTTDPLSALLDDHVIPSARWIAGTQIHPTNSSPR